MTPLLILLPGLIFGAMVALGWIAVYRHLTAKERARRRRFGGRP